MYSRSARPARLLQMSHGVLNLPRNVLLDWTFGHSLISCHVEHHLFPFLSDNMCLKVSARRHAQQMRDSYKLGFPCVSGETGGASLPGRSESSVPGGRLRFPPTSFLPQVSGTDGGRSAHHAVGWRPVKMALNAALVNIFLHDLFCIVAPTVFCSHNGCSTKVINHQLKRSPLIQTGMRHLSLEMIGGHTFAFKSRAFERKRIWVWMLYMCLRKRDTK